MQVSLIILQSIDNLTLKLDQNIGPRMIIIIRHVECCLGCSFSKVGNPQF